ncbi:hypothetical protein ACOME3_003545 [Neoechinorhynchus agilis]
MNRIACCLECYLPLAVINGLSHTSKPDNIVCDVYLPAIRRLARACKAYPAMTGKCQSVLTYFIISLSTAGMISRRELEQLVDDVVGVSTVDSPATSPKPLLTAPPKLVVPKASANLLQQVTSNLIRPVKRASWPTIDRFSDMIRPQLRPSNEQITLQHTISNPTGADSGRMLPRRPSESGGNDSFYPFGVPKPRYNQAYTQIAPAQAPSSNWRQQPRPSTTVSFHYRNTGQPRGYFPWGNGPNTFTDISTGMRDVPKWLKFLRLHKYNALFASMSYEEMLNLDESYLEQRGVTKGARDKIIQNIERIKQRPNLLKAIIQVLEVDDSQWYDAINNLFLISVTPIPSYLKTQEDQQVPNLFVRAISAALDALRRHSTKSDASLANLSRDRSQMVNVVDRFLRHEAFSNENKELLCNIRKELCALSFTYIPLMNLTPSATTQNRIRTFLRDENSDWNIYSSSNLEGKQRTLSGTANSFGRRPFVVQYYDNNSPQRSTHAQNASGEYFNPLGQRHSIDAPTASSSNENGLEPLGSHTLLHRCRSYYGYNDRPTYQKQFHAVQSHELHNRPAYVTLTLPQSVIDEQNRLAAQQVCTQSVEQVSLQRNASVSSQGELPPIDENNALQSSNTSPLSNEKDGEQEVSETRSGTV